MAAIDQNASIYCGDTVALEITVTDADLGGPMNLTGASLQWAMYGQFTGTVVVQKATGGQGITITNAVGGVVVVALDPADTLNVRPDDYGHELEVTDALGNVGTVTTGYIELLASRT